LSLIDGEQIVTQPLAEILRQMTMSAMESVDVDHRHAIAQIGLARQGQHLGEQRPIGRRVAQGALEGGDVVLGDGMRGVGHQRQQQTLVQRLGRIPAVEAVAVVGHEEHPVGVAQVIVMHP
jgi:hypothetical protein